jgi:hypothetical protein
LLVDEHISGINIPGRTTEDVLPVAGTISGYIRDHPESLIHNSSNAEEILTYVPDMMELLAEGLRNPVHAGSSRPTFFLSHSSMDLNSNRVLPAS